MGSKWERNLQIFIYVKYEGNYYDYNIKYLTISTNWYHISPNKDQASNKHYPLITAAPLAGIFPSTFLKSVNGSKNSILSWKLNLVKPPMKLLKFQEKSLPLQTNNVQDMLQQLESVLEISSPAIWWPKLQKRSLW